MLSPPPLAPALPSPAQPCTVAMTDFGTFGLMEKESGGVFFLMLAVSIIA
jgi:hypothetical protein